MKSTPRPIFFAMSSPEEISVSSPQETTVSSLEEIAFFNSEEMAMFLSEENELSSLEGIISITDLSKILAIEDAAGYKWLVLIPELKQMMFVAGETGEPSSDTLLLVEQIVHEQVQEMVSQKAFCGQFNCTDHV